MSLYHVFPLFFSFNINFSFVTYQSTSQSLNGQLLATFLDSCSLSTTSNLYSHDTTFMILWWRYEWLPIDFCKPLNYFYTKQSKGQSSVIGLCIYGTRCFSRNWIIEQVWISIMQLVTMFRTHSQSKTKSLNLLIYISKISNTFWIWTTLGLQKHGLYVRSFLYFDLSGLASQTWKDSNFISSNFKKYKWIQIFLKFIHCDHCLRIWSPFNPYISKTNVK